MQAVAGTSADQSANDVTAAADKPQETTASARKIQLMTPADVSMTEAEAEAEGDQSGYRLIDMDNLSALVDQLACPACKHVGVTLKETKRYGMDSALSVVCLECTHTISTNTSKFVGRQGRESNVRLVAAARNSGIGYAKVTRFCAGLNLPKPLHLKTYQTIQKKVRSAAVAEADSCLIESGKKVREAFMAADPSIGEDDPIDICITYDGTWHKRGHTSHHGVGVVVDLLTGLVIDYEALSNHCHGCLIGPDPESPEFAAWKTKHTPVCQRNYSGSSGGMEVAAAKAVFGRSLALHNLRYKYLLCDGDTKTYTILKQMDIYYGIEIIKEDCINHVAKRMYTAIEILKNKSRGTDFPLTGKGRLTVALHKKLPNYYANALKKNKGDPLAMKNAVYAGVFHMVSTDEEPHHTYCPPGESSWCFFRRAEAKNEQPEPHKKADLSKDVLKRLLPIYERLTAPELMERCARMKTQNANECFNAQIWRRVLKTDPTSLNTVRTGVAMATLEFNCGPQGFSQILRRLGVRLGYHQGVHIRKATQDRLKNAEQSMSETSVNKRKRKKIKAARQEDLYLQKEGVLYSSGAF